MAKEAEIMVINKMRLLKKKIREGNRGLVYALLRELRADFNAIERSVPLYSMLMNGNFLVKMKAQTGDEFWVADDKAKVEEEVDGLPVLKPSDLEKLQALII